MWHIFGKAGEEILPQIRISCVSLHSSRFLIANSVSLGRQQSRRAAFQGEEEQPRTKPNAEPEIPEKSRKKTSRKGGRHSDLSSRPATLQKYIPLIALWRKPCLFLVPLAGWRDHPLVWDLFVSFFFFSSLEHNARDVKNSSCHSVLFSSKTPPPLRWCYLRPTVGDTRGWGVGTTSPLTFIQNSPPPPARTSLSCNFVQTHCRIHHLPSNKGKKKELNPNNNPSPCV